MRKCVMFLCALSLCLGAANASEYVVNSSETASFFGVDSNELIGDASNIITNWTFTGGFLANNVVVTGNLTEVLTGTYASEADISLTAPGGSLLLNPTATTSYVGTLPVGPTNIAIGTPFDPAGNVSFEFYESYSDGVGPDQTWDDISIEFQNVVLQNGSYNLGALPSDGTLVTNSGTNVAGGLDFYDFSVGAGVAGPGDYLNIQGIDPLTGDNIDTEFGLFDSAGVLVAFDDDGQESAFGGLYSMLSFGADDPLTPAVPSGSDATPGEDGLTLAAGAYTLVLGGYNSNFDLLTIGVSTLADVVAGTSAGDYDIQFSYVPEPTTAVLLGLAGLIGLRRRR